MVAKKMREGRSFSLMATASILTIEEAIHAVREKEQVPTTLADYYIARAKWAARRQLWDSLRDLDPTCLAARNFFDQLLRDVPSSLDKETLAVIIARADHYQVILETSDVLKTHIIANFGGTPTGPLWLNIFNNAIVLDHRFHQCGIVIFNVPPKVRNNVLRPLLYRAEPHLVPLAPEFDVRWRIPFGIPLCS